MRRRFCVIINAGAGLARSGLVQRSLDKLEDSGANVTRIGAADFAEVRAAAQAAASSSAYDAIVAAGGDGTVRHVAAALIGSSVPVGLIPAGTANVLAHEIGLAITPQAVAHTLLAGRCARVACARANGEPFLLMVSAGFDARVVSALDHRSKSRLGKFAYAGPVLGALVRPIDVLNVRVDDDKHHEASWVVVANARHYGGRFVLAPRAGVTERGLEAVLFKSRNRAVLLRQLTSLVLGSLNLRSEERSDVTMLRCARVHVSSRHPVPAQIDGDKFGSIPLVAEAGEHELQLIVPSGGPAPAR